MDVFTGTDPAAWGRLVSLKSRAAVKGVRGENGERWVDGAGGAWVC